MYCSRIDVCSSSRRACNFVSMMCLSSGNARSQGSKQCTSTPGTDTTCTEKQSTSWHLCHYRGQEGFWLEDYHIVNECKATGEKPAQPLWHAKDPQHASMHAGRTLRQIETTCKTPRYNVPCWERRKEREGKQRGQITKSVKHNALPKDFFFLFYSCPCQLRRSFMQQENRWQALLTRTLMCHAWRRILGILTRLEAFVRDNIVPKQMN